MNTDKKRGKGSRYNKRRRNSFSKNDKLDIDDFEYIYDRKQDDETMLAGDDYTYNYKKNANESCDSQKTEDFLKDEMSKKDMFMKTNETKNNVVNEELLSNDLNNEMKENRSCEKSSKKKRNKKKKLSAERISEGLVGDLVEKEPQKEYFKCIYTSTDSDNEKENKENEGILEIDNAFGEENNEKLFDAYEERLDYSEYNEERRLKKENDILEDSSENDLPIIELSNVSKTYQEGIDAVKDISFRIDKGEFVFIVGKSGSGKSTLIKLLTREIRPTNGRVYVNGREIAKLQNRKIAKFRRSIGVVFQDFKLLMDRNVFDNVAFAQRVIGKSTNDINRNVPAILSVVGLSDKFEAFPYELSGGEQQRVALARALVNEPTILLADEPTGNLDPKTAWEIIELLDEINKRGTTVIVVTHNVDIVNEMRKRVITIEDGSLASDEKKGGYLRES